MYIASAIRGAFNKSRPSDLQLRVFLPYLRRWYNLSKTEHNYCEFIDGFLTSRGSSLPQHTRDSLWLMVSILEVPAPVYCEPGPFAWFPAGFVLVEGLNRHRAPRGNYYLPEWRGVGWESKGTLQDPQLLGFCGRCHWPGIWLLMQGDVFQSSEHLRQEHGIHISGRLLKRPSWVWPKTGSEKDDVTEFKCYCVDYESWCTTQWKGREMRWYDHVTVSIQFRACLRCPVCRGH